MQFSPEKTFWRNGVHLNSSSNKKFQTSSDHVTGVVHYDPPWGIKSVTELISTYTAIVTRTGFRTAITAIKNWHP
jgi:hypothetical protein